jgi:zinc transport system ATP-binding protein
VVELRDVTLSRRGHVVLEDVTLTVERNDYLAVLGPNGSGKTTLLLVVLGVLEPDRGTVRVLGRSPSEAHGRIGYVPQTAGFDRDFPIRVSEVALMGRLGRRGTGRRLGREDLDRAHAMLERMEVAHLARRPIGALSGGELQRVLIARALATEPELLLLDEPTSGLDEPMEARLWQLLGELTREMAVMLVSHDVGAISRHVQRVACLNRRLFVHAASELTGEVLERIYGQPLTLLDHDHSGPAR